MTSSQGSIDWLCLPRFDSDPVFGRLIDPSQGGSFAMSVDGVVETRRRYRPASAVLETTWTAGAGAATLTEAMLSEVRGSLMPQFALVRRLVCDSGEVQARVRYDPRPGLPGREPRSERRHGRLVSTFGGVALALQTAPDLSVAPGREATVTLRQGEALTAVLTMADGAPLVYLGPEAAWRELEACDRWWQRWCGGIAVETPYRHALERSLITLRLLTYSPTGAPVAAPTTSLPEEIGGGRNWDYRFSWPRDASVGTAAFLG
ncbi:MAG TPA: glycoside hydrolase family 15 protein, partial [Solirubrobacterales bacterium]|nr:glycoside hydrolase family 15 protein [Solirubrobacterales bacterium]